MVKLVGKVSNPSTSGTKLKKNPKIQNPSEKTQEECSKCAKIFPVEEIETYYGKPYCITCLKEKKRRKKVKKKRKNNKSNSQNPQYASNPTQSLGTNQGFAGKKQLPPFPKIKRDFLAWLTTLDINDYFEYRGALNRIKKYNRPAILKQTIELFWEYMLKEELV